MKTNRLFFTSSMIMAIATFPAISEENYYNSDIANSCQVDFLGGTGADNSTAPNSFQAQYTANQYTVDAGQYLAADAITGTQCPANSFCTGGTYTFSETNDQGMTSCPTGFTLSAAGTSAQSDCYHTCTASDVENGEKLSGTPTGNVYQDGRNQCNGTCTTGYTFRAATAGTNPLSGKESIKGTGYAAKGNDGNEDFTDGNKTASDYNLTQNGSWGVSFSYGNIIGISSCNGTLGDPGYDWMYYNDSSDWSRSSEIFNQGNTGGYCWCKITGYTPTGGTLQSLSSAWVYSFDYGGSASGCAYDCASICTYNLKNNGVVRSAMFGVIDTSEPPACIANTINVTWNPANGNAATTNQCTYDGAITLPDAPEKTGYTFKGWKLVTGSRDGDM